MLPLGEQCPCPPSFSCPDSQPELRIMATLAEYFAPISTPVRKLYYSVPLLNMFNLPEARQLRGYFLGIQNQRPAENPLASITKLATRKRDSSTTSKRGRRRSPRAAGQNSLFPGSPSLISSVLRVTRGIALVLRCPIAKPLIVGCYLLL